MMSTKTASEYGLKGHTAGSVPVNDYLNTAIVI